ncbi:MAG: L-threonylcarbamoyladenylate synthase [Calditrichia bacterium]
MIRLELHPENPQQRALKKAAEIVANGGLIIYPTDTQYGIGCDLYNKNALEKLYHLKHKSKFDPISVMVSDIREASKYAKISNYAYRVLKHCTPGPYTFILPASREIPRVMLSRRKEVGIRLPESEVCLELVKLLGNPLVNTSVTFHEDEVLNDPDEIATRYGNDVDVFLDMGWLEEVEESTIVSLLENEPEILRRGKGDPEKVFER